MRLTTLCLLPRRILNSNFSPDHKLPTTNSRFMKKEKIFRLTAWLYGDARDCKKVAKNHSYHVMKRITRELDSQDQLAAWYYRKRVDAALAEHNVTFYLFDDVLKKLDIRLDLKMLNFLAIYEPKTFKSLAMLTKQVGCENNMDMEGTLRRPEPENLAGKARKIDKFRAVVVIFGATRPQISLLLKTRLLLPLVGKTRRYSQFSVVMGVDFRLADEGYKMQKQLEELQDTKERLSKISQLMEELQVDQKTKDHSPIFSDNKPYLIDDTVFKNLQDQHCKLNEMKNKLLGLGSDEQSHDSKPRKQFSVDLDNRGHSRRSSSSATSMVTQLASHSQLLFHVQSMMYLLTTAAQPCCKCQQANHEVTSGQQLSKIVQEQQQMMSSLYAWQQELYSQQIKLSRNLNDLCSESLKLMKQSTSQVSKEETCTQNYCIEMDDHKNQDPDQQEPQIESVSITVIAPPPKIETETSKTSLQVVKEELEAKVKDLLAEVSAVLSENDDLIFNTSLLQFVRKLVISLTTIKCLPSVGSYANNNFLKKQLSSILDDTLSKFKGFKVKDCSKEILCDVGDVVFNEVSFFRLMQNLSSTSTAAVKDKKKNSLCLPINESGTEKFTEKSKSTSCLVGTIAIPCGSGVSETAKNSDDKRTTSVSSLLLRKPSDRDKKVPKTQVTTATDEEEDENQILDQEDHVMSKNDQDLIADSEDIDHLSSDEDDLEKFGALNNNSCSSDQECSSSSSSMHTASPQGRYFKIDDQAPIISSGDISDVEIV